jgi:hypothetical protein
LQSRRQSSALMPRLLAIWARRKSVSPTLMANIAAGPPSVRRAPPGQLGGGKSALGKDCSSRYTQRALIDAHERRRPPWLAEIRLLPDSVDPSRHYGVLLCAGLCGKPALPARRVEALFHRAKVVSGSATPLELHGRTFARPGAGPLCPAPGDIPPHATRNAVLACGQDRVPLSAHGSPRLEMAGSAASAQSSSTCCLSQPHARAHGYLPAPLPKQLSKWKTIRKSHGSKELRSVLRKEFRPRAGKKVRMAHKLQKLILGTLAPSGQ